MMLPFMTFVLGVMRTHRCAALQKSFASDPDDLSNDNFQDWDSISLPDRQDITPVDVAVAEFEIRVSVTETFRRGSTQTKGPDRGEHDPSWRSPQGADDPKAGLDSDAWMEAHRKEKEAKHAEKEAKKAPVNTIYSHRAQHGNILQWLADAFIAAEARGKPRVAIDDFLKEYLGEMFVDLPNLFEIDRPNRAELNEVTSTCAQPKFLWTGCQVPISLRKAINAYYLVPYLPKGCGEEKYDGVVFHLRSCLWDGKHKEAYVQPPCQMYADVMERGGFKSARAVGRGDNPCFDWLVQYRQTHNVQIEIFSNRSFKEDICELVGATNLVLASSTMSLSALLLGGLGQRNIWGLLPNSEKGYDAFQYYGLYSATNATFGGRYFKDMCDSYNMHGYTCDRSYWEDFESGIKNGTEKAFAALKNQRSGLMKKDGESLGLREVGCPQQ